MLPEMKRIAEDDYDQRRALMADGWREIEVLETYAGKCTRSPVRMANADDIARMRCIASAALRYDRLHSDEAVDWGEASDSKGAFIADAMCEGSHWCFVYGADPDGFLIAHKERAELVIDLIAVYPGQQGKGIGRDLIEYALARTGMKYLRAGTQMTNEPAKKLYESLGMSVVKRERTFHK